MVDCKKSIALRPNYFYAYNNLGTAYLGMGDYENALAILNKAVDIKPKFFWSRVNRAKAYSGLGKYGDAAKDYEYALILDPTNDETRHALDALRTRVTLATPIVPPSLPPPPLAATQGLLTTVGMEREGGTYVVPVLINETITLKFVVDSGASEVSIPADVVSTLIRTGTVEKSDFIGSQTYILADGSKIPSVRFRLRSLKVGDKLLKNVTAGIAPAEGGLLLGQSFLSRFKSWSVDNTTHTLVLNE